MPLFLGRPRSLGLIRLLPEEMRSLRLVLDEIKRLRASQVDILALLQQRSDSKADLARLRKLSQSLVQSLNAHISDNMKDAVMKFWRKIFPDQENISKSLERWMSLVHQDPRLTKVNPPPLFDCQLVTEDGTTSKLTSFKVSSGEFKQRLEALWAKISSPPIGTYAQTNDPSSYIFIQLHQAWTDDNGSPRLSESGSEFSKGHNGIPVWQHLPCDEHGALADSFRIGFQPGQKNSMDLISWL
jgi:hypothetical protein